jgi:hypothetical protein
LAAAWLAGVLAKTAKVSRVGENALANDNLNGIHRLQWRSRFNRVKVQRGNPGGLDWRHGRIHVETLPWQTGSSKTGLCA